MNSNKLCQIFKIAHYCQISTQHGWVAIHDRTTHVYAARVQFDWKFSARRNPTGLSKTTFNRITKLDLKWHPYTMNIRHELFPQDSARRLAFCIWLVERCVHFWPNLVIGDEASFQMNARVSILHHCTFCDELISRNLENCRRSLLELNSYYFMLCE